LEGTVFARLFPISIPEPEARELPGTLGVEIISTAGMEKWVYTVDAYGEETTFGGYDSEVYGTRYIVMYCSIRDTLNSTKEYCTVPCET
jgi:hypothetical protein